MSSEKIGVPGDYVVEKQIYRLYIVRKFYNDCAPRE